MHTTLASFCSQERRKKRVGGCPKGGVGNSVRSKETADENRTLLEFIFEFH